MDSRSDPASANQTPNTATGTRPPSAIVQQGAHPTAVREQQGADDHCGEGAEERGLQAQRGQARRTLQRRTTVGG